MTLDRIPAPLFNQQRLPLLQKARSLPFKNFGEASARTRSAQQDQCKMLEYVLNMIAVAGLVLISLVSLAVPVLCGILFSLITHLSLPVRQELTTALGRRYKEGVILGLTGCFIWLGLMLLLAYIRYSQNAALAGYLLFISITLWIFCAGWWPWNMRSWSKYFHIINNLVLTVSKLPPELLSMPGVRIACKLYFAIKCSVVAILCSEHYVSLYVIAKCSPQSLALAFLLLSGAWRVIVQEVKNRAGSALANPVVGAAALRPRNGVLESVVASAPSAVGRTTRPTILHRILYRFRNFRSPKQAI
ncbi:LOW QUALITY PROTEIN: hypothetical protein CVT26_012270 [Gymnopilus dilepis]|uniref:Uncharacterized protein n=1 Tax=Gymnopilus dilepis TaxID=231916 RepID=A0A409YQ96_9AGAR|nr:LOW QUALITY PROTEIN: hypothetical protein CVT26_012270 [Gymnopilus dilepis]